MFGQSTLASRSCLLVIIFILDQLNSASAQQNNIDNLFSNHFNDFMKPTSRPCKSSFLSTPVNGSHYLCHPHCQTGYFLYPNGSCLENCNPEELFFPRKFKNHDFCGVLSHKVEEEEESTNNNNGPLSLRETQLDFPINNPLKSQRMLLSSIYVSSARLGKPLHHIRYLEITLPSNLPFLKISRAMNILSLRFTPYLFESWRAQFPQAVVPLVFGQFGVSSSFISNCLDDLLILAGVLILGILSFILEKLFQFGGCNQMGSFFKRLRLFVLWNFSIILVVTNAGDYILYASLEYRTYTAGSNKTMVSLCLSVVMLALISVAYIFGIYAVCQTNKPKITDTNLQTEEDAADAYQYCQVFWKGFRPNSFLSRYFFIIYSIYFALPMIIAALLFDYPLMQIIFYISFSALMVLFIVLVRPTKSKLDLVYLFFFEFIRLMIHISCLMLYIYIEDDTTNADIRIFFANFIVVGNIAIYFVSPAFLVIKFLLGIRFALQLRGTQSPIENAAWLQLLYLPVQAGGFFFEQFEVAGQSLEVIPPPRIKPAPPSIKIEPVMEMVTEIQEEDSGNMMLHQTSTWIVPKKTTRKIFPETNLSSSSAIFNISDDHFAGYDIENRRTMLNADSDQWLQNRNLDMESSISNFQTIDYDKPLNKESLASRLQNLEGTFPKHQLTFKIPAEENHVQDSYHPVEITNQQSSNNYHPHDLHPNMFYKRDVTKLKSSLKNKSPKKPNDKNLETLPKRLKNNMDLNLPSEHETNTILYSNFLNPPSATTSSNHFIQSEFNVNSRSIDPEEHALQFDRKEFL